MAPNDHVAGATEDGPARYATDLSVIIPAYNEQDRLERTLREAVGYFRGGQRAVEIIVVDDGSRDRTSEVVRTLERELPELRLIRLPANRGKGYAVRTGVANARGRLVLFADADGATPIGEVERVESALDDGFDMAIGSRGIQAQGTAVKRKFYRHVIGRTFHTLVQLLTVKGFVDTQCGFKIFRAPVAHDLFARLRIDRFSFDVELLVIARQRGYAVAEVPVNWTHQPGSRVNLVVDSLRMARDLVLIRGRLLRGAYEATQVRPLATPPAPDPAAAPTSER